MKYKITVMVLVLIGALVAPFFIKGPDGKPLMTLPQADSQRSTDETRQTYFKWQDAQGQWHFGDEVPEGAVGVPVNVDTAANVLQSVKVPVKNEQAGSGHQSVTTPQALPGLPMTVNPADIPGLINDAQNVQSLVDERSQQLQQVR